MPKPIKSSKPVEKPSFWRSSAGVMTGIAVGVGLAGIAAVGLSKKSSNPPTPPTPTPTPATGGMQAGTQNPTTGQTTFSNVAAGYYYLNVLSTSGNPTAAMSAVGFGQIQAQADPFNTNNWLVTAYWTAPGGATTFTDGGSTWQVNVRAGLPTLLASAPPVPQPVTGLVANNWYTFSVRTSFPQNATDNGESAAGVLATVLESSGWGSSSTPPLITAAADTSATPDTWNVAAQWTSTTATTTQDAPPLWVFLGAPVNVGTATPPQPANTMP